MTWDDYPLSIPFAPSQPPCPLRQRGAKERSFPGHGIRPWLHGIDHTPATGGAQPFI